MVVGNLRGGLSVYRTQLADCTSSTSAGAGAHGLRQLQLSPNPARSWVRVEWPDSAAAEWYAFNILGQLTARGETSGGAFTIPVGQWPAGTYFLELRSGGLRAARAALRVQH
jgi:hypothetical protein